MGRFLDLLGSVPNTVTELLTKVNLIYNIGSSITICFVC